MSASPLLGDEAKAHGPLQGVRVLDVTTVVLGPMATQILGDLGADVVKIEGPEGDLMRANGVSRHPGMSSVFMAVNRNKRSVVLDLKTPEGKADFLRLAAQADVLVHNMRVPAMERLGLGYEVVRTVNPRIVYCVATGFGQDGPDAAKPAFDDIVQAACGLASLVAQITGAPAYVPSLIADKTAGMAVANAVMAALFHRERTGEGQCVEVPMFECLVEFTMAEHMGGLAFEPALGAPGYGRILQGGRAPVETADGHVTMLPYSPRQWADLFRRIGREDLCAKHDFGDRHKLNSTVRALYRELALLGPERSTREWLSICAELDIPSTRIQPLDELLEHPHLRAVGAFELMEHPSEGRVRQIRPAVRFSRTPAAIRRLAPRLGEHTQEILDEARRDATTTRPR